MQRTRHGQDRGAPLIWVFGGPGAAPLTDTARQVITRQQAGHPHRIWWRAEEELVGQITFRYCPT